MAFSLKTNDKNGAQRLFPSLSYNFSEQQLSGVGSLFNGYVRYLLLSHEKLHYFYWLEFTWVTHQILYFFFPVTRVTKSPTLSVWESGVYASPDLHHFPSGEKGPFKFGKKKDQEQINFFPQVSDSFRLLWATEWLVDSAAVAVLAWAIHSFTAGKGRAELKQETRVWHFSYRAVAAIYLIRLPK